jgi:phosphoribosylformylglycinamidine synthase
MAVVIEKKDQVEFISYCEEENIEATVVAEITDTKDLECSMKIKL